MKNQTQGSNELKRSFTLWPLTLYGLGAILGAGIYVLIGEIAARAGMFAPVSFFVAAAIAGLSALSYAELSSRHPRSASEVIYVKEGLRSKRLAMLVGGLVVLAGVVSAATLANGFAGYLRTLIDAPAWLAIACIIALIGGVAAWGISESAVVAVIATVIELCGLLLIVGVTWPALSDLPSRWHELTPSLELASWHGVMLGAFLAFYAFIGFEDMVNVAEEVKDPRRTMPTAVLLAVAFATVLYIVVSAAAVLSVRPTELAQSEAPLALVYARATGKSPDFIAIIGLFAVVNGMLVQIIMAARVLYGMSLAGWLPAKLGQVHPARRTPLHATLTIIVLVLLFALWLPLATLARTTSFTVLLVFFLIHVSLLAIKLRETSDAGYYTCPLAVPALGAFATAVMICFQLLQIGR